MSRYLLTDTIKGEQRDDVHDAIYNNWIMIKGESDDKKQWISEINPLITPASAIVTDFPESPEMSLLKQWAEQNKTSPFGLGFDKGFGEEYIEDSTSEIEIKLKNGEPVAASSATLAMTRIFDTIDSESSGLRPSI